jgi:hypothetical protein
MTRGTSAPFSRKDNAASQQSNVEQRVVVVVVARPPQLGGASHFVPQYQVDPE